MVQLLALLRQLGPKARLLLKYLAEHADQITALVALLTELFGGAFTAGPCEGDEFVAECEKLGCDSADAEVVANALAA